MTLLLKQHADEIREGWRSRVLRESKSDPPFHKVLIAALTRDDPGSIVGLMKATFPGFVDFDPPMFVGYAMIDQRGAVVCEAACVRIGVTYRGMLEVYESENEFIYEMRRFADYLKLTDKDRTEFFGVLQRWVVSDSRVDHHGRKLDS